ncbi:NUDIX hydrolase domain,NUDIX hydrolase domain-like,Ribosomal protein L46 [Cinara cedri]|uniref:Large ribosomal subunit protein mL46 n=1 Tax=Cinara cedri TaxID=506608 RepID=A0A5E4N7U1_9HEMI|nr:NUDIX hydrolase domain,NUDIX hydrolase domain-like,Ribosomal protein L46 [Cinara cedri]
MLTFFNRTYSTQKVKWDIMAGICLQRKPVITKSLTNIEVNYQNILQEIEFEKSLKSDHELRHDKDVQRIEQLKKGKINFDDADPATNQSAQDYLDQNKEELLKFKLSSRITEADEKMDNKSLNRKLEENLIFVIKQKLGHDDFWILPQGLWTNGETLKETAERVLKESCGNHIRVRFYGNAPCGFYKYKYPKTKREQSNVEGAKIFFFKATLLDGNVEEKCTWKDYEWATVQELNNRLIHPYMKSIKLFLSNYNV